MTSLKPSPATLYFLMLKNTYGLVLNGAY